MKTLAYVWLWSVFVFLVGGAGYLIALHGWVFFEPLFTMAALCGTTTATIWALDVVSK